MDAEERKDHENKMYIRIRRRPRISGRRSGGFGYIRGGKGVSRLRTRSIGRTRRRGRKGRYEVGVLGNKVNRIRGSWIDIGRREIKWGLIYDSLTIIIYVRVRIISRIVHRYSYEYIKEDPYQVRFIVYLTRFTFFILRLLSSDNYIQIFIGWEGVGFCSYLLINYWHTRLQANKAGIKAIRVNRIGDIGLRRGRRRRFNEIGGLEYSRVFNIIPGNTSENRIRVIGFRIRLGVISKSAQLGMHTWLPDAIEGPTPVSALIHAATIVTVGIYRRLRSSPRFEYIPSIRRFIIGLGGFTTLIAGRIGLFQHDIKRVIAYSTCSQLGYILRLCGISSYDLARFHLINHAMYKALLFLTAGSIIHARDDEQDIRRMGGRLYIRPRTYGLNRIGSLSLMGFPFISGFYSKDILLESSYAGYNWVSYLARLAGISSGVCTGLYSVRLLYYVYRTKPAGYKKTYMNIHEPGIFILLPLRVLGLGSIFSGWLLKDVFVGLGTDFFSQSLFTHPDSSIRRDYEYIPRYMKLCPLVLSLCCSLTFIYMLSNYKLSYILYSRKTGCLYVLYIFINKKMFFDKVYNDWISTYITYTGYHTVFKLIDRGLIDTFGPYGISTILKKLSYIVVKLQSGSLPNYIFLFILASLFIRCVVLLQSIFSMEQRGIVLIMSLFVIK